MPFFNVVVERTYYRSGLVKVEAADEDAAEEIVKDKLDEGDENKLDINWNDEYDPDESGTHTTGDVEEADDEAPKAPIQERVFAFFQPQIDQGGHIYDSGPNVRFDVTDALLKIGEAACRKLVDNDYSTDDLAPEDLMKAHQTLHPDDAPFTVNGVEDAVVALYGEWNK